jgi:threonine dehydratase
MTTLSDELAAPPIGLAEVRAAAQRLAPYVHRTPVFTSRTLDERTGATVLLKCENLQRVGAFKFRGAMNAVLQLEDEERKAGVITHSSGNHGQALALAGKLGNVPVCIVMPRTAPAVKRAACEGYGARIVTCEPTLAAREDTVADEIALHGYSLVHPYNDWRVIAGQGTVALELLEQASPLDLVVCPVGGGGLLSGVALAIKALSPQTQMFGAEPALADDALRSLAAGKILPANDPPTIADGLRASLGERTFCVLRQHVDGIVTTSEAEILQAMRFLWERVKLVVEPSGAVSLAPLLAGNLSAPGKRIGVVLSGGNVDLEAMFAALEAKWL